MDCYHDRAFANPGSIHAFGQRARGMLDRARLRVARLIGAESHEIIFTGGGTAVASVMLANNETGVLQPVPQLARAVRAKGVLFHTDAVQAAGKLPLSVRELEVDLLSLSGHNIHGPKGVGALCVRSGTPLAPVLFGGHQERGLRPGTENVPAIVGFGKACELAAARLAEDSRHLASLRDAFEEGVADRVPGARINGAGAARLPNTSSIHFPGLDADMLAINLDLLGLAVSTGSACSAADRTPSHVLLAMGWSAEAAHSTIRLSFGRTNTADETAIAIECVRQAVAALGGCR